MLSRAPARSCSRHRPMAKEQPKTILEGRNLTCLESIGALAVLFAIVAVLIGLTSGKKSDVASSAPTAAPVAPAPPPPLPPAPEPVAAYEGPARPAIAGSKAAFESWFRRLGVDLAASTPVNGSPRDMGTSADKLLTVEVIGRGDALEKASLLFAIDNSNTASVATITGAVMVFMRETGWNGGHDWVIKSMKAGKKVEKTHGNVTYAVNQFMPGAFTLSAAPKVGPPAAARVHQ